MIHARPITASFARTGQQDPDRPLSVAMHVLCHRCGERPATVELLDDGATPLPRWFPRIEKKPFYCQECVEDLDAGYREYTEALQRITALETKLVHIHDSYQMRNQRIQESSEDRETLGQLVRAEWIQWAREQPDSAEHPHWLTAWDRLAERDQEVDRRIGQRIARYINDGRE